MNGNHSSHLHDNDGTGQEGVGGHFPVHFQVKPGVLLLPTGFNVRGPAFEAAGAHLPSRRRTHGETRHISDKLISWGIL